MPNHFAPEGASRCRAVAAGFGIRSAGCSYGLLRERGRPRCALSV